MYLSKNYAVMDTSSFYEKIAGHEEYRWMIDLKMGRYLRSPTLYEDCFKIMATSRMKWTGTKNSASS
jgi:hypothetical protein